MVTSVLIGLLLIGFALIFLQIRSQIAFPVIPEGFSGGFPVEVGDPTTPRCGVDLPSCPEGTRCMNGYC